MTIDELTHEIIAKAIRVHTELGPPQVATVVVLAPARNNDRLAD